MIPYFKGRTDPQILISLLINWDVLYFLHNGQKSDKKCRILDLSKVKKRLNWTFEGKLILLLLKKGN